MKKIISLLAAVFMCLAAVGCSSLFNRKSEPVKPHLIDYADREPNPVRRINDASVEEGEFTLDPSEPLKTRLSELFEIVVKNGKRPVFTRGKNVDVKKVYDAAIAVLDRYIKNDFTPFERVHAIHDYLTSAVVYDEKLYLQYLDDSASVSADDPSFDISGVFLNRSAVCNGFARAVSFLCAVEGIESDMTEGTFSYSGVSIAHVWNKVKLDGDWYNLDATMDSIAFYQDKGDPVVVPHHGFFLLSDAALKGFGGHNPDSDGPPAQKDYPFHQNQPLFDIDGKTVTMQVNSRSELIEIFKFIKKNKRKHGQVELRLNLGLSDYEAGFPGAYSDDIAEAYKSISGEDYTYLPDKGIVPFMQYPRGVFVFLIYK
ncbi:MAG: hypothetical protein LBP26_05375 [Clostridiales bacterium]|jgi:hypothetical protein|nr:hypothetical protein [Clostridiales bacterium]